MIEFNPKRWEDSMAISGNPKKMAHDIANGYVSLNQASLKKYTTVDLKTIRMNLEIVYREIRSEQVDMEDHMAAKEKNTKMSRLNQAMVVLQSFAKRRRIPI